MGGRGSEPSHLIGRPGLSWGWGPPPMNGSQTVMARESEPFKAGDQAIWKSRQAAIASANSASQCLCTSSIF